MARKKAASRRNEDACGTPLGRPGQAASDIVAQEYERGCRWASIALIAMFAVLSLGAVMLGW